MLVELNGEEWLLVRVSPMSKVLAFIPDVPTDPKPRIERDVLTKSDQRIGGELLRMLMDEQADLGRLEAEAAQ